MTHKTITEVHLSNIENEILSETQYYPSKWTAERQIFADWLATNQLKEETEK